MLLVIDAGNSNMVLALMDGDRVHYSWRHPTDQPLSVSDFESHLAKAGVGKKDISDGVLGSVVPGVNETVSKAFEEVTGLSLFLPDRGRLGITVGVDEPDQIGIDRVMNAFAGVELYRAPLIAIDFGTATTFTVVDKDKTLLGGAIGAGIETSLKTLHVKTANLPDVAFGYKGDVIGRNTRDAMGSAAFYGALSLIEGMVGRFEAVLGKATVVATGGLSAQFEGHTKVIHHFRPDLTLQGLRLAYEKANA